MDLDRDQARQLLGVAPDASPAELRAAYRALMRLHHPDVATPANGSINGNGSSNGNGRARGDPDTNGNGNGTNGNDLAARLTSAYALLSTTDPLFPGGSPTRTDSRPTPPPPDGPPRTEVRTDGAIVVEAPGPETFMRVHEALDEMGHVTYQDRSAGYLQAMVQPDQGPLCTLVAAIEPRSIDSVVLVSVDSMDASDAPDVEPFLLELARLIGNA